MTQANRFNDPLKMLSLVCALLLSSAVCATPELMNRDQIARLIQNQYGGQILDLQPLKSGDDPVYRVKLLQPSGRIKLMLIDARDGKRRPFDPPAQPQGKN